MVTSLYGFTYRFDWVDGTLWELKFQNVTTISGDRDDWIKLADAFYRRVSFKCDRLAIIVHEDGFSTWFCPRNCCSPDDSAYLSPEQARSLCAEIKSAVLNPQTDEVSDA